MTEKFIFQADDFYFICIAAKAILKQGISEVFQLDVDN